MLCWGRIGWSWGCGLPLKDWELRSHINVFVCLCNDSMEVIIHKKKNKERKDACAIVGRFTGTFFYLGLCFYNFLGGRFGISLLLSEVWTVMLSTFPVIGRGPIFSNAKHLLFYSQKRLPNPILNNQVSTEHSGFSQP